MWIIQPSNKMIIRLDIWESRAVNLRKVSTSSKHLDWLADTDEEIDEQELEEHYSYMAKIQEVPNADSGTDAEPLEQDDQNETEFERFKAFNDRTVDYDKLELVKEKHDELVKQSLLTKSQYEGLVKEKTKVGQYGDADLEVALRDNLGHNRTLVEAARTRHSGFSTLPLFFWLNTCNAAILQTDQSSSQSPEKTAYHIINDTKKTLIKHLTSLFNLYLTRDIKVGKMKEKLVIRAFWWRLPPVKRDIGQQQETRPRSPMTKRRQSPGQSIGTPMATKPKLDADLSGTLVDQTDYHSKIGSLMYLTSSRPDIMQADSGFELTAFLDADHTRCIDTRKSTSRGIQFLGDKLVSWMSKKQDCTAMSLAEAEYVALSASCAQVMWMRTQLKDYGFNLQQNTIVLRLSVSHSNLMQPRTALPYQAYPYSISFHQGTG
ncbi:retrovirus-related pol polyprotein from transposon TNT 1-94 [Tanacetum coccineum]